jgi:hypothetical protein
MPNNANGWTPKHIDVMMYLILADEARIASGDWCVPGSLAVGFDPVLAAGSGSPCGDSDMTKRQ